MTALSPRILCLPVILAACAGAPPSLPAAKARPPALIGQAPSVRPGRSIPVFRPDTTRVERMPVLRPNPLLDRKMVWPRPAPVFPETILVMPDSSRDSTKVEPR